MTLLSLAAGTSLSLGYLFHGMHMSTSQPLPDSVLEQLLVENAAVQSVGSSPPSQASLDSQNDVQTALPIPGASTPLSLAARLSALHAGMEVTPRPLRILQIGDSHTAGDFFTEQLRRRLQARYGDAGIGWIIPGPVSGQAAARYSVRTSGVWTFQTGSSRTARDLPLGGFMNTGAPGSRLLIQPTLQNPPGLWRFGALVRRSPGSSAASVRLIGSGLSSQAFPLSAQWMPVELSLPHAPSAQSVLEVVSGRVAVAGLWLEREGTGVVLDHVGRNGATLTAFQRWSDTAMFRQFQARPVDAIVLAYGTNEAVDQLAASTYASQINTVVRRLQSAAPGTPIILLTAPSFSQGGGHHCAQYRPPSLRAVVSAQLAAAGLPGVQVWNWMQAMGGECSVSQWVRQGLMAGDWIHMTPAGYRRSADLLYGWLHGEITPSP